MSRFSPSTFKQLNSVTASLAEKANQSDLSLKADKTYVDTQIQSVGNGSPKGTYATLTALQSAYPSGTNGIYVVTADGGWYYWNGSVWTKGGTYQSTSVPDSSVRLQKLGPLLSPLFVESGYTPFNMPLSSFTMGSVMNYSGSLVAASGQGYMNFTVNGGDKIIFTSRYSKWTPAFVVTDASNNFLMSYPASQPTTLSGDVLVTAISVILPDNAKNIYFNIQNTTYAPPTASVLSDISLNFSTKQIKRIDLQPILKSTFGDNYTTQNLTYTDGSAYYSNGQGVQTYSGYAYTSISPNKGDKFLISGTSYFNIKPYVLLNADGTINSYFPNSQDNTATYYNNLVLEIPSSGMTLKINSQDAKPSIVMQSTSYTFASYQGKKWAVLGDSLTEANANSSLKYHDIISQQLGFSVYNLGKSGTGYKATEANNTAFYQRISSIPTDTDVVTFFGSGNDNSIVQNGQLGTYTDTGTTATLAGCINTTIDNLYAILPTARLGIITPTPWKDSQPNDPSNPMVQIANLIVQICNYRGIPCLDLYHNSGLRPDIQAVRDAAYYNDSAPGTTPNPNGVHPNNTGHSLIAPRIREFIKSLI